ncbi:2-amino-4-hydroxy-6-hydroxymethyldihydropteridine diphosphokinase [Hoeflea sp. CAU 1731]
MDGDRSGSRATLGLGGNVGDPRRSMAEALKTLDADPSIEVEAVSRLYRTPPWGPVAQDWFLNSCAVVRTTIEPLQLLEKCKDIEQALKRQRIVRWGPRTIDIDILTFDDLSLENERLTIPHPRMQDRGFVLLPLSEIAGDVQVRGRTVSDWSQKCDKEGIEVASENGDWWRGS